MLNNALAVQRAAATEAHQEAQGVRKFFHAVQANWYPASCLLGLSLLELRRLLLHKTLLTS